MSELPPKKSWPASRVTPRAISELIPYVNNARTHSEEQVAQIAASMKEWGWTNPVLIDESGTIIAGHGRIQAARLLGIDKAPTMVAEGWSEAQKKAYTLADNKLAENAGWDESLIALELDELSALGFDIELTGLDGLSVEPLGGFPGLPEGDRLPYQEMTFCLHDEQVKTVKRALSMAPRESAGLNENGNANALAAICEAFLEHDKRERLDDRADSAA